MIHYVCAPSISDQCQSWIDGGVSMRSNLNTKGTFKMADVNVNGTVWQGAIETTLKHLDELPVYPLHGMQGWSIWMCRRYSNLFVLENVTWQLLPGTNYRGAQVKWMILPHKVCSSSLSTCACGVRTWAMNTRHELYRQCTLRWTSKQVIDAKWCQIQWRHANEIKSLAMEQERYEKIKKLLFLLLGAHSCTKKQLSEHGLCLLGQEYGTTRTWADAIDCRWSLNAFQWISSFKIRRNLTNVRF